MRHLGATSDFTPIAARYDATREVPAACLQAAYRRFVDAGLLPVHGLLLDAGCGTGQMSLPLAEMGYGVRGYDISGAMVSIAQAKTRKDLQARYAVADVRRIPDDDGSFDGIVVSKLFQHVEHWREGARELLRVLKPGACILSINETGAFKNPVRQFFSARADSLGYAQRFLGVQDKIELAAFFAQAGCEILSYGVDDLGWSIESDYGEAFDRIDEGLFAEFWYLPELVRARVLAETAHWIRQQPQGRETPIHMTPHLTAEIFRKAA